MGAPPALRCVGSMAWVVFLNRRDPLRLDRSGGDLSRFPIPWVSAERPAIEGGEVKQDATKITGTGRARLIAKGDQCRCSCGALLARVVQDGLELKCRKCKSVVLIRHDELVEMYRALEFEPRPPILPPIRRA